MRFAIMPHALRLHCPRLLRHVLSATMVIGAVSAPLTAQRADSSSAARRIAVRAAHLVDPKRGRRIDNAVVLIEGEKITAVGEKLAIPSGTEVIDLGTAT